MWADSLQKKQLSKSPALLGLSYDTFVWKIEIFFNANFCNQFMNFALLFYCCDYDLLYHYTLLTTWIGTYFDTVDH